MTNREWLNSLSNEDFIKWCLDPEVVDFKTLKSENPSPRLESIKYRYTSSRHGLLDWLNEERVESE